MRTKSAQEKAESAALLTQPDWNGRNQRHRLYCKHCKRLGQIKSSVRQSFRILIHVPRTTLIKNLHSLRSRVTKIQLFVSWKYNPPENRPSLTRGSATQVAVTTWPLSCAVFSYTPGHPSSVELEINKNLQVVGKGTIEIDIVVNVRQIKCRLKDVLHVPDLGCQILSVRTFDKSGLSTSFRSRSVEALFRSSTKGWINCKSHHHTISLYNKMMNHALRTW